MKRELVMSVCACAALTHTALAQQTITVPTDQPTLEAAVLAAQSGDTIELLPAVMYVGNYTIPSTFTALTIRGVGASPVEISGPGSGSVLFSEAGSLRLENLRITAGQEGGLLGYGLELFDCEFIGNGGSISGAITTSSPFSADRCVFHSNSSSDVGGAITVFDVDSSVGSVRLSDCAFTLNTATNGGGAVYLANVSGTPETVLIERCEFTENSALVGGAISGDDEFDYSITDCSFAENSTDSATPTGGGAVRIATPSSIAVRRSVFEHNTSASRGGAIQISSSGSQVLIDSCAFNSNSASAGGAVVLTSSPATVTGCSFIQNDADIAGAQNTHGGGALLVDGPDAVKVVNSLIVGNSAVVGGAAAVRDAAWLSLHNTTITSNTAMTTGGAVHRADTTPGITLANSIVYGNLPAGTQLDIAGAGDVSVRYSLIEGGHAGDGNIASAPQFVDALSGNYELMGGSPAIDAGNNDLAGSSFVDLAGNVRGQDDPDTVDTGFASSGPVIDMGAYEFQPETGTNLPGCSVADIAEPYDVLDFSDVIGFLGAFGAGCP